MINRFYVNTELLYCIHTETLFVEMENLHIIFHFSNAAAIL